MGCRSVAEVDDDVRALDAPLDVDERAAIDDVFARHGIDPCPSTWIER